MRLPRRGCALALTILALASIGCTQAEAPPPEDPAPGYVPRAVYCADGSGSLCGVIPSMIGPDSPVDQPTFGYPGLTNDVQNANEDSQSPFDNMAWQMFVALNQPGASGSGYVWGDFIRVEEVFGHTPASPCANPDNLPVFEIAAKSGGQPSDRTEEFLQAATNLPLIDRNGNWALFDRRMNDVELKYLKNSQWDLTTLAGQEAFVEAGHTVDFTESEPKMNGTLGAMELKMAWRILDPGKGDDPSAYITTRGLVAVDSSLVYGSDQPICDEVTLGLVGFHILQKNPKHGVLLPEWIWASFEHQDNVPEAPEACDPVESGCYLLAKPPAVCAAPTDATGIYSFFDSGCTDSTGTSCAANVAPKLIGSEDTYLWSSTQPYAGRYLNGGQYGTQAVRCWQIYALTRKLNEQWRAALANAGSVMRNYTLIGTQWGATVEPEPGKWENNAVPSFLSNSTMETYIQTEKFGSCIDCHRSATLAYTATDSSAKKVTYPADFSFLLGLAE